MKDILCRLSIEPGSQLGVILYLLGHLAMSGDWQWNGNATVFWWVEFRDAAKLPTMRRTAANKKELLG